MELINFINMEAYLFKLDVINILSVGLNFSLKKG